jgi:two-component system, NtrC family, response regulator AtoC
MSPTVLLVEDNDQICQLLVKATEGRYLMTAVHTAERALECAADGAFDIAVVDVSLPGSMSGLELIPMLADANPNLEIIVISGIESVEAAVRAMKCGAVDFLLKPFGLEKFFAALASKRRRASVAPPVAPAPVNGMIAVAPAMQSVLKNVETVAGYDLTVLVTGETGVGKEMVVRALHNRSRRAKKPFVALNCAAVPEQLLEDEMFGHVKGAFTGAQNAREGRFEQANGGALFLDEIGDMSLNLQSKLLRVLQEREFEKIGASKSTKVDVRVIAATSANLEQRIERGEFRADLFYRLNVVRLHLPPLRERREDITPLAVHFLTKFCASTGLPQKTLDERALDAMLAYHWPGNVRQLQNAMERTAAMTGAAPRIELRDLPDEICEAGAPLTVRSAASVHVPSEIPEQGINFDLVVGEVERELLYRSLEKTGGNKLQAARLLNMKRTTFVDKLKRFENGEFGALPTASNA